MGSFPKMRAWRVSCTKNNSNPKGDRETKQTNKKKGFGFGAKTERKVTFGGTEVSSLSKKPDFRKAV